MKLDHAALEQLVPELLALCRRAGEAILAVYNSAESVEIEFKSDQSPLTRADSTAHTILVSGLTALAPQWPILSEEAAIPAFAVRRNWPCYWLVDPLDGTKEFIARNGEFTVNIALVVQSVPVLGIVYEPLADAAYVGIPGVGAWCYRGTSSRELQVQALGARRRLRVITSSRHGGARLQVFIERLEQHFETVELIRLGSAAKFCRLVEGAADIYPRFAPCSEWDTAAGQALLTAAGGALLDLHLQALRYNQRETLINPDFYALAAPDVDWQGLLNDQSRC